MPFKDIEQARQYRRDYYKQRRSNGICTVCGNPTKIEEAKCQACKDSNRNYVSEIAQRRRSTGLCLNCGKPTREGKTQCQACADYQTLRISERRTTYKKRAVEYLGGQCVDCGLRTDIVAVYDFHHRHSEEKSAAITRMLATTKSWSKIQEELDKCGILCANCHMLRHASEE